MILDWEAYSPVPALYWEYPVGSIVAQEFIDPLELDSVAVRLGPAGAAGVVFEQSFSSLTTWTVNHGFGREPDITVLNSLGNVVEANIVHTTVNQTVIYFNAPYTGKVIAR